VEESPKDGTHYEILNFSVPGYSPLQQLVALDKVWAFEPDAVWYVAAGHEGTGALQYLVKCVQKRVPLPYSYLQDVVKRAGIGPSTPEAAAMRRLQPMKRDITFWVYHQIVLRCKEHGVQPVWVFVPWLGAYVGETEVIPIAREAGFVMIDLGDVYKGYDPRTLWITEWDGHPNAKGHEIIAGRLFNILRAQPKVLSYRRSRHELPGEMTVPNANGQQATSAHMLKGDMTSK